MIPKQYYLNHDVVFLAKDLIGKTLCSNINGHLVKSIIVETEAYEGVTDKASHAYNHRFTERTKVMYEKGGISYVYLCYGLHHLFNIVTHQEGTPHAVLIRGVIPTGNLDLAMKRRKLKQLNYNSVIGPAKVSQLHGFNLEHNAMSMTSDSIYLEECLYPNIDFQINASPRIGIDYAEEDALLNYRFNLDREQMKSIFHKVNKYE